VLAVAAFTFSFLLGSAQAIAQNAYITNFGEPNNTVSVIDTATDAVIATIPVGNTPWEVAVSPNAARFISPAIGTRVIQMNISKLPGRIVSLVLIAMSMSTQSLGQIKQPPTMEQCRTLAKNSDKLKELYDVFGLTEQDKRDLNELAAVSCFVYHDPRTSSWSNDRKNQIVAYRFCSTKANEIMPGDDAFSQSFRQSFQRSCEASTIESIRNWRLGG